ncbi:MAG: TolC family protein [Gemmataceae bacterium]
MRNLRRQLSDKLVLVVVVLSGITTGGCTHVPFFWADVVREQRNLEIRDPAEMVPANIPELPRPITVTDLQDEEKKDLNKERKLSLNEAIHIALRNSEVVRVLAGITAVSSGTTIYDTAITNTLIDQQRGRFDPTLLLNNTFNHIETPIATLDFAEPAFARIAGTRTDTYTFDLSVAKTTVTGGRASLSFTDDLSRFSPGTFPLDPENRTRTTLRLDHPLLKGAGIEPNLAPIVIARLDTERSFYRFKGSVQELVRGVIDAYWSLVFARTDVWAREKQVATLVEAVNQLKGEEKVGRVAGADVTQTETALFQAKATLVASRANLIQREAALRNLIGLPPSDGTKLVPSTQPTSQKLEWEWDKLVKVAEQHRPDLIELKLIIEADTQRIIQAENQALPNADLVALYRWNGLSGSTPSGANIDTNHGQFTDWILGVNIDLPLGLRQDRAFLRQSQLALARDLANLDQGLHAATHDLATTVRNLSQFYEQYQVLKLGRTAARENLQAQVVRFRVGQDAILLNVLQAVSDWANVVSAEAQALAAYNTELATLELETGTILETHQIQFFEDLYGAKGPMGRHHPKGYPSSIPPGPNAKRYSQGTEPAENFFILEDPLEGLKKKRKKLFEEEPTTKGQRPGERLNIFPQAQPELQSGKRNERPILQPNLLPLPRILPPAAVSSRTSAKTKQ